MPESEYLVFEEVPAPGRKTKVIRVESYRGAWLGHISWYGAWRQYAFRPGPDSVLSDGCMEDIQILIRELMAERKVARQSPV